METVEEKPKKKREKPEHRKIPVDTKIGAPQEVAAFLRGLADKADSLNAVGAIVLIPTYRGATKYASIGRTRIDDGAMQTVAYLTNIDNEI